MKRYPKYKDSGVKWIGEIPEHWEVMRMKSILNKPLQYGANESGIEYNDEQPRYIRITDITIDGNLKDDDKKSLSYEEAVPYLLNEGDILFARSGATVGKAFLYHEYMGTSAFAGYLIRATLNHLFMPKMLFYYTQSSIYELWKNSIFIQSTIQNIGADKYKQLPLCVPTIPEQQAIVAYLDDKVGKIDRYISEKEKEIVALDELKQATIANAVTRGLDPNAPLKDSGIKWIGNIPQHWEVSKIRRLFKLSKEKTETSDGTLLSLSQYTGVRLKSECEKTGMFEAESTVGYNVVHKGQFVMNIMLAWNGSYAVSNYDGIISPAYCVFDFQMDCIKQYFDYLLRQKSYAGAFKTMSKGLIDSRLRLYPDYFKTFPIIIPPIKEQQAIVDYINTKTAKIDQMKDGIKSEIEKLKEYKQRLISDVVTGKVCVKGEK